MRGATLLLVMLLAGCASPPAPEANLCDGPAFKLNGLQGDGWKNVKVFDSETKINNMQSDGEALYFRYSTEDADEPDRVARFDPAHGTIQFVTPLGAVIQDFVLHDGTVMVTHPNETLTIFHSDGEAETLDPPESHWRFSGLAAFDGRSAVVYVKPRSWGDSVTLWKIDLASRAWTQLPQPPQGYGYAGVALDGEDVFLRYENGDNTNHPNYQIWKYGDVGPLQDISDAGLWHGERSFRAENGLLTWVETRPTPPGGTVEVLWLDIGRKERGSFGAGLEFDWVDDNRLLVDRWTQHHLSLADRGGMDAPVFLSASSSVTFATEFAALDGAAFLLTRDGWTFDHYVLTCKGL